MLSRNKAQQLAIGKTTVMLSKHYPEVTINYPLSTTTTNIPLPCLTLSQGIFLYQDMKLSHFPAIPSYLLHYNLGQVLSLKHFAAFQVDAFELFASFYYLLFLTTRLLSTLTFSLLLTPCLQIHLCHDFLQSHYSPLIS